MDKKIIGLDRANVVGQCGNIHNTDSPSQPSDSFMEVMAGLNKKDEGAARVIYMRYISSVVRLAQKKLDPSLGARVDPESVAQSVMASFFEGHGKRKYVINGWPALYGFLAKVTYRKALNRNRLQNQLKRNDRLDPQGVERPPAVSIEEYQAVCKDPGPAEEAEMNDLVESVLQNFKPDHRKLLEIFLQHKSKEQTALATGYTIRTVERVTEEFCDRILEQDREDG